VAARPEGIRAFALLTGLVAALVVVAPATPAGERETVTVRTSAYGRILFDGRGYVLYAFTSDPRGRSVCRGECATRWPPHIVRRAAAAGTGAKAALLGTTKRADGTTQATYAGRPLYYYVGDTKPGVILCQNASEFGGLWLVISANGKLVR
jgi:predicted lipoprotein with Yx(FWY)xxD motif